MSRSNSEHVGELWTQVLELGDDRGDTEWSLYVAWEGLGSIEVEARAEEGLG